MCAGREIFQLGFYVARENSLRLLDPGGFNHSALTSIKKKNCMANNSVRIVIIIRIIDRVVRGGHFEPRTTNRFDDENNSIIFLLAVFP